MAFRRGDGNQSAGPGWAESSPDLGISRHWKQWLFIEESEVIDKNLDKVKGLFAALSACEAELEELNRSWERISQKIAELTCPYKVGDTLKSDVGLGRTGLKVHAVTPPAPPIRIGNTWMVQCFAISKAGDVTQRTVGVSESMAKSVNLRLAHKQEYPGN